MKNQINLLSIAFLFMISCTGKNNQDNKETKSQIEKKAGIIYIDPRKFGEQDLTLTDFAADIEYVPLSNELRIGSAQALQITSNAIYFIYDNSGGGEGGGHQQLYRFERNGEKPIMIGNVGRGPHEYLSSDYYVVDEENDRIYINGRINTVLVFNTKGKFIRDFKFQDPDIRFGQLQLFGNKYLFVPQQRLGARAEYLWSIIDTLGNVITSKRNYTPAFETHSGARIGAYSFNRNVSYWVDYNDTIFTISPDFSYKPSFIITPGDHREPKEELPVTLDLPVRLLEYYSPHTFMETKTYLISRYNYKGKFAYLFLDKNSLKTSVCYYEWKRDEKGGIPNNFDGGLIVLTRYLFRGKRR